MAPSYLTLGFILLLSISLSIWSIWQSPILFWNDPHIRLALADHIFVGRWLPLTQFIIFLTTRLTESIQILRFVFALTAACAAATAFLAVRRWMDNALVGLVTCVLLVTQPLFIPLATVPYQETLFILCIFGGLYWFQNSNFGKKARPTIIALICFALAGITRYEGWFFIVILPLVWLWEDRSIKNLPKMLGFVTGLTVMPLIFIYLLGLSTITADSSASSISVHDNLLDFREITKQISRFPLLVFAFVGIPLARSEHYTSLRFTRSVLMFIICQFLFVNLFNPFSVGNLRRPFLTVVFLLPFASNGLAKLFNALTRRQSQFNLLLGLFVCVFGIRGMTMGLENVVNAGSIEKYVGAHEIGLWIDENNTLGKTITIVSDNAGYPYFVATYSSSYSESFLLISPEAVISSDLSSDLVINTVTSRLPFLKEKYRVIAVLNDGNVQIMELIESNE